MQYIVFSVSFRCKDGYTGSGLQCLDSEGNLSIDPTEQVISSGRRWTTKNRLLAEEFSNILCLVIHVYRIKVDF